MKIGDDALIGPIAVGGMIYVVTAERRADRASANRMRA